MTYFSINKATGVALPYADQKFAYFALLPDKEMTPREWLAEQDQSLFNDLARLMAKNLNIQSSWPCQSSKCTMRTACSMS